MTTTKTMTARTVRQPKNHKKIYQLVDHTISLMTSILKEKNIERMSNTFDVTHTHTHCAVHLLTQASLFSACRFIRTFSQHSLQVDEWAGFAHSARLILIMLSYVVFMSMNRPCGVCVCVVFLQISYSFPTIHSIHSG